MKSCSLMVEQANYNRSVVGSSPTRTTVTKYIVGKKYKQGRIIREVLCTDPFTTILIKDIACKKPFNAEPFIWDKYEVPTNWELVEEKTRFQLIMEEINDKTTNSSY
jgi:hypothetical protein